MRRSTKVALATAVGIAALTAQVGPYAVDPLHDRNPAEQHRIDRTRTLLSRLDASGETPAGPLHRLLALAAGSRVMSAAASRY